MNVLNHTRQGKIQKQIYERWALNQRPMDQLLLAPSFGSLPHTSVLEALVKELLVGAAWWEQFGRISLVGEAWWGNWWNHWWGLGS
jgi:hypothetical protein